MNTNTDNKDDVANLQAVMGDYFDALLRESAASAAPVSEVPAAIPVAESAPPVSDAVFGVPSIEVAVEAQTAVPAAAQTAAAPCYQLIRIGGLTLGIPAHAIAKVVTVALAWAPSNHARAWGLGSYSYATENYTVVDTAARLGPGSTLQASTGGNKAVLLAGQRWALACDGIGAQITPDPAQINWRGAQGKRPWLAGTARAPACALLDIPELTRLLDA